MNVLIPLLVAVGLFVVIGRWYSRRLAKMLGEDPNRTVPAIAKQDGQDYVPTSTPVVFAHHFASIAGAGPIVGPILALVYGWHWCWLWVVFGALFFGSVHDYLAMYMSVREDGATIVGCARKYMGKAGYTIFILFVVTMLLIVNAVFLIYSAAALTSRADIADLGFQTVAEAQTVFNLDSGAGNAARIGGIGSTSVIILTVFAPLLGWMYLKKKVNVWACSLLAVILCILSIYGGFRLPVELGYMENGTTWWVFLLAIYCLFAAGLPVWIFLQSRDFINVHILYVGLAIMALGIVSIGIQGLANGGGQLQLSSQPQSAMPADAAQSRATHTDPGAWRDYGQPIQALETTLQSAATAGNAAATGKLQTLEKFKQAHPEATAIDSWDFSSIPLLWPGLFITIACGAVSGFHSLCASGTASRQVTSEPAARQVAFYSMLLEGALAVMVIVAVGYAFSTVDYARRIYPQALLGGRSNPIVVFSMAVGRVGADGLGIPMWLGTVFGMLMLEGFLVTTLDTAVRITRYLVEELIAIFKPGLKLNPWFTTCLVLGGTLAITFFGSAVKLWQVFGTGNQLLAAFGLIVASLWLIKTGRNAVYALIPACVMLITTVTMLTISLIGYIHSSDILLLITASFLLFLGAAFLVSAVRALTQRIQPAPAPTAP